MILSTKVSIMKSECKYHKVYNPTSEVWHIQHHSFLGSWRNTFYFIQCLSQAFLVQYYMYSTSIQRHCNTQCRAHPYSVIAACTTRAHQYSITAACKTRAHQYSMKEFERV